MESITVLTGANRLSTFLEVASLLAHGHDTNPRLLAYPFHGKTGLALTKILMKLLFALDRRTPVPSL